MSYTFLWKTSDVVYRLIQEVRCLILNYIRFEMFYTELQKTLEVLYWPKEYIRSLIMTCEDIRSLKLAYRILLRS